MKRKSVAFHSKESAVGYKKPRMKRKSVAFHSKESAVGYRKRQMMKRKSVGFHNEESAVGYKQGNNQPLTEEVTGVWSHSNVWIQGFAVIGFFALLKSMHSVCAQKSGDTLYQDVSQEA